MTATPASGPRTVTFLLRQPRQVQGFREQLCFDDQQLLQQAVDPDGSAEEHQNTALTLLWIPPGRFWMGSPETEPERFDREGPQHLVQLQGFFMCQTLITQGQWREVAGWKEQSGERWGRELEPEPSFFQPRPNPKARNWGNGTFSLLPGETTSDQRPVENVSWLDANEFCNRLSQRTGRHYTLPSEARWEYACRAGTSMPFHFGVTITPALANYDGNYIYGGGPKGKFREQTTPAGMFPANAWGLQDMHGNVWEWCLDHWHDSYEGAPLDGSAWLNSSRRNEDVSTKGGDENSADIEDMENRLLRGGSWSYHPGDCRSAHRALNLPGLALNYVGFRVVCLPQGPSLNP
jgi:formylglycine-generating enzyme required for sulfatase activity